MSIRNKALDLKETKYLYGRLMILARSNRNIYLKQAVGNYEFTLTSRAKLCEHIIHCVVIRHLNNCKILSDAQNGFRKQRSCETQLILTIDDLAKGVDDRAQLDMFLFDYEQAFDKVSHRHLMKKPEHYG